MEELSRDDTQPCGIRRLRLQHYQAQLTQVLERVFGTCSGTGDRGACWRAWAWHWLPKEQQGPNHSRAMIQVAVTATTVQTCWKYFCLFHLQLGPRPGQKCLAKESAKVSAGRSRAAQSHALQTSVRPGIWHASYSSALELYSSCNHCK